MQSARAHPGSVLPFARILVLFALWLGGYYAFSATGYYEERIFQPYVSVNTDLSGWILERLGYPVTVKGQSISSPLFFMSVGRGCDGLEPTALFVAAVLAFTAPFSLKLPALAIGVPLLVSLNLVRLVSLFLTGVHYPDWFHVMHVDVWQVLYIGVALVFFALWLLWATRPRAAPRPEAAAAG